MILPVAKKVLRTHYVCDNCLGRQFAQLLTGLSNQARGRTIRPALAMEYDARPFKLELSNFWGISFRQQPIEPPKPGKCWLCGDFFKNLDRWVEKVKQATRGLQFKTFLVGTKVSRTIAEREEKLWDRAGLAWSEPFKSEANRELGKLLEKRLKKTAKEVRPDLTITIDLETRKVRTSLNPLYFFGLYQKLVRGIPQTKWERYKESVEDIIARPFMAATQGTGHALHGCVAAGTRITLNDCSAKIEDLEQKYASHEAMCYSSASRLIEKSEITDWFKLAKQTYRLRTKETGREIMATPEHPFFTPEGMIPLANLRPGNCVAVNPTERELVSEQNKMLLTEKEALKTIEVWFPTSNRKRIVEELKSKGLVPLETTNPNTSILVRLVTFLFGDGHVKYIHNRDVALEFYGQKVDLETIRDDLKHLGFYSQIHGRMTRGTKFRDYSGKARTIKPTTGHRLTCYSKPLWTILVALGAPVGNKVKNDLMIPAWIFANRQLKQEFLATLLGCEIDTPRLDKRKHNRKSFNTPRFSMNKAESKLKNGLEFIENICKLLNEFGVETLPIRKIPYTMRKDGEKSIKLALDISNKSSNLIKLWQNVGLRYCKAKETTLAYALEYLKIKQRVVSERQRLFTKAQELYKQGHALSKVHSLLNSNHVAKGDLWLWIHNKIKAENIKVPNEFPNFDEWLKTASAGLSDGLVWETVESIYPVGKQEVYDITVPMHNNFFANGFLVSNSGREDIDARCLGWRPFVLEIKEPKKRSVDLKKMKTAINRGKKVKVKDLKTSDKKEVIALKEARPDKSYRALVEFERPLKGLAKLKQLQTTILQKTPSRVLHRRPDLLRKRRVKELSWKKLGTRKLELLVRGEAGLYVKELVTGDGGRTRPSAAALLKNPARVLELDVTKVWFGVKNGKSK